MIAVIIAGGSGSRLWPLSTADYPKHLLKINGDSLSLLQHTYERARRLADHVYVISEVGHIDHVKQQLSELNEKNFIVEPGRRGTANCILAALAYIAKLHNDSDEAIAFMHADHYVRDVNGFVNIFRLTDRLAIEQKRLVLIGVEPDYPATGFGYIEKGDSLDNQTFVYNVKSFKEKPDYDTARDYLKSGNYLWNGGYFVATFDVFLREISEHSETLNTNYRKLIDAGDNYDKIYLEFESEAIDYALIERVSDLLVVPASFDWMDLGSFSDLHKATGGDIEGNYLNGKVAIDSVSNSYVYNSEEKPVAVIGLDNVAVINTPKGMLVVRKDLAQKVGEIGKRF